MKLVRARPKLPECFPDWARCCPEYVAAAQAEGEMVVDLDSLIHEQLGCSFCKADHGIRSGVMDTADKKFTEIELLDLDEGPVL